MNSGDFSGSTFNAPVHLGTPVDDIRTVVLGIFHENAPRLYAEARRIAEDRCEDFLEQLVKQSRDKSLPQGQLAEPDVQYQINAAAQASVRTADPALRAQLAALLVRRLEVGNDSLRSLIYNEAIAISSKLTANQVKLLALILMGRYAGSLSIQTILQMVNEYLRYVESLLDVVPGAADLNHLIYAGCVKQISQSVNMHVSLTERFPLLFQRGLSDDELASASLSDEVRQNIFVRSLDNTRWLVRIAPSSLQVDLPNEPGSGDVRREDFDKLSSFFQMPSLKDMNELINSEPLLQRLVQKFSNNPICGNELLPVGLVIAGTYMDQAIGYHIGMELLFENKAGVTIPFSPAYGQPR